MVAVESLVDVSSAVYSGDMRGQDPILVQADFRGRLLLPKDVRERLGLEPRGSLTVEQTDDGAVVLRNPRQVRRQAIEDARGSFAGRGGSVDDLIAARRVDAAREAREDGA